jgi:hypothetical protein
MMSLRRLLSSLPLVAAVVGAAVYTTACCCCGPGVPDSGATADITQIHREIAPPAPIAMAK